jgi:phosphatidylglycerophosphate synthase
MRMMVAKKNVVVAANIYGKIKTFVLMIAIALLFLVNSKTMSSILMPYYTGTQFINGTPSNAHDF